MTKLDSITDLKKPGAKNDAGKLRFDLVDDIADEALVAVLTLGAAKYSEDGWREVANAEKRYFAALRRHGLAMRKFFRTHDPKFLHDEETGLPHVAQFLTNAHFLAALMLERHHPDFDGEKAAKSAIEKWEKRKIELMELNALAERLSEPAKKTRKKAVRK